MFCPNCGTKNEVKAVKCGQCGFDLKAKAAASKFQGTVMMKGGPTSPTGAGKAAVGQPPAHLKGTMVGVAPPGIEQLRQQAAATLQQKTSAAAAEKATKPGNQFKGTMMGMAPPHLQTGLAPTAGQPAVGEEPKAQGQPAAAGAKPAQARSQLKGTMIGVAPPDVQADLAAAKAAYAGRTDPLAGATSAQPAPGHPVQGRGNVAGTPGGGAGVPNPDFMGTMPSEGVPLPPDSARATDHLGGTMPSGAESPHDSPSTALDATTPAPYVSPFASGATPAIGGAAATGGSAAGQAHGAVVRGGSLNEEFQHTQMSSQPPPGGVTGPAPAATAAPAHVAPPGMVAPPPFAPTTAVGSQEVSAPPRPPIAKSKLPLFLLAGLLVLALLAIFVLLSMGEDADDSVSEAEDTQSEPALELEDEAAKGDAAEE